jgi:hypothetical protein
LLDVWRCAGRNRRAPVADATILAQTDIASPLERMVSHRGFTY